MGKWFEIRLKLEDFVAKLIGGLFVYALLLVGLGSSIALTKWVLTLIGVM